MKNKKNKIKKNNNNGQLTNNKHLENQTFLTFL